MASRKHLKAVPKATDTTAIVVNWPTRALHDVLVQIAALGELVYG